MIKKISFALLLGVSFLVGYGVWLDELDVRVIAQHTPTPAPPTATPMPPTVTPTPATFPCCIDQSCGCAPNSATVNCGSQCTYNAFGGLELGGTLTSGCIVVLSCVAGSCHPVSCSYGGRASCSGGLVPAIDNCGGINCVSPGTCDGSPPAPTSTPGGGGSGPTNTPPPGASLTPTRTPTPTGVVLTPTPTCTPNCGLLSCAGAICGSSACVGNCGQICFGLLPPSSPSAPVLNLPVNNAVFPVGSVNLSWFPVSDWGDCSGAQTYSVCVGSNAINPCTGGTLISGLSSSLTSYNYLFSSPGTYYWRAGANNGSGFPTAYSAVRSIRINSLPSVLSVDLHSSNMTVVPWGVGESGTSHIQEIQFKQDPNPRTVIYDVSLTDPNGWNDISSVEMSWNGQVSSMNLISGVGLGVTARTSVNYPASANSDNLYPIMLRIADGGGSTGWFNSGYYFKVWDGFIEVIGEMYDASDEPVGAVVSTGAGFTVLAPPEMNFTDVNVVNLDTGVGTTVAAVNGNSFSTILEWGYQYLVYPNPDLDGSNIVVRWIDLATGLINSGSQRILDYTTISPLSGTVNLDLDFSAIRNQSPWFQVEGGSVNAVSSLSNMVPVTCGNDVGCVPAILTELPGRGNNGLVSASTLANNSGCSLTDPLSVCKFGQPNNWYRSTSTVTTKEMMDYNYFYTKYFVAQGLGVTVSGNSNMTTVLNSGGTGVFLINGDFNVDTNNSLALGGHLVIVVRGTISFETTVTSTAGVFVANGGISVLGQGPQLTINGVLLGSSSTANIRLGRDLGGSLNNVSPGVRIVYRPDMMFNLPGSMLKLMSNWRTDQ